MTDQTETTKLDFSEVPIGKVLRPDQIEAIFELAEKSRKTPELFLRVAVDYFCGGIK